ncbi:MAG: hypothetical protein AAF368_14890, partial [Planctomycetota bacterium]
MRRPEAAGHSESIVVALGYREQMYDGRALRDEVRDAINDAADRADESRDAAPRTGISDTASDSLQPGDRIRLRDFVFEIRGMAVAEVPRWDGEEAEPSAAREPDGIGASLTVFVCEPRFARVLHNRLAIVADTDDDEFLEEQEISVERFIELPQWSVATDLYGLGAVALYTVFRAAWAKKETSVGQSSFAASRKMERQFTELVEMLETIPYFQSFFGEIANVVHELEKGLVIEGMDPETLAKQVISKSVPSGGEHGVRGEQGQVLSDYVKQVTNNITLTLPHAKVLLEFFDNNAAQFLFVIHFALSCLHRRSHFSAERPLGSEAKHLSPFAESRVATARSPEAAIAALGRVQALEEHFGDHRKHLLGG